MKKKDFLDAITELGNSKGLSKEQISEAIRDSFALSLRKKFEDEMRVDFKNSKIKKMDRLILKNKDVEKLPDALIRVDLDLDKANIKLYREYKVLDDNDITDDYLEIPYEIAIEKNKKLKIGDYYDEEIDFNSLTKKDVDRFVANFKQKISAYEKEILAAQFKEKFGTIVTGVVEKSDNISVLVNIGKGSITLYRKDLIGDEHFTNGDTIKVYVQGFKQEEKKNNVVSASRSCPEYLKKLFESAVIEIADGVVEIVDIARLPGKRSKVVVRSNDPNVDASGACIGKNGERIQNIVVDLGNSRDSKEKVDVVLWHKNLGAYLQEILKPAEIIGINFDNDNNTAIVITKNGTSRLAIGPKAQNLILAKKLTHLHYITIVEETELEKEGITSYKPIEEYLAEDANDKIEEERRRFREENIRQSELRKVLSNDSKVEEINGFDKDDFDDEDLFDENIDLNKDYQETVEEAPVEKKDTVINIEEHKESGEVIETPKTTKAEKVKAPIELKEVKTTTTLESLEKSLEEEKKAKNESKTKKSSKKKENKEVLEETESKKPIKKMDIYTEEELREFEDEENEDYYDDEDDWSEYDSDDFYEDK